MEEVKWVPVRNFEGAYEVSSQGEIKSCYGKILKKTPLKKYIRNKRSIIFKIYYSPTLYVKLYKNGRQYNTSVTSAVVNSFGLANIAKRYRIVHKDGDQANDNVDNLEIVYLEDKQNYL